LWLKNNRPEVFYQTHKFLLLEDYLLYRLTGQFVTETSLQSSSLLLNLHTKTWWPEMLDFLGIPPEKFGTLCTPGQVIGPLSPQASAELGLSTKTLVVAGSMDQVSASLGAGNIYPGMTTESTGGAMGIVVTLQHPVFDPRRQIPCHVHALPEQYCVLAWGQTAGMALRWFRDQFYTLEAEQALQAQLDPYDYLTARAAEIAAGCDGLLALPHLEGAACPEFDPDARAVFFGATLRHTRAHFTRAILEAVAYMLKKNLDSVATLLEQPISELRCLGGGARSSLWMQIKADVLQKPVQTVRVEEAACLGAAILGAVACGVFSNYSEAVASMVHTQMSIWPNPNNRQVYAQGYAHYNQLYERLQPLFSQK
jgi:xylulokinase